MIYAMALQGHFPAFAGRLTSKAGTPAVASALQTACTLALLWTGYFESLLVYASVGLSIFSMLAISAVLCVALDPSRPRPPVPHAGLSGHTGRLSDRHRRAHVGGFFTASARLDLCTSQHPGWRACLLSVGVGRRSAQGRLAAARLTPRRGFPKLRCGLTFFFHRPPL